MEGNGGGGEGGITLKSSLLFPFYGNYLWAPCPLMEASSHGKEGNQINCMSVNRITSSLTCHESGLKLITHAWRTGKNGAAERRQKVWQRREEWRGGNGRLEVFWGGGGEKEAGVSLTVGTPSSAWRLQQVAKAGFQLSCGAGSAANIWCTKHRPALHPGSDVLRASKHSNTPIPNRPESKVLDFFFSSNF